MSEDFEVIPRFSTTSVSFIDTDSSQIRDQLVKKMEEKLGRRLQTADPLNLVLDVLAYQESMMRAAVNTAAQQNLLSYAQNNHLDALGQFVSCSRAAASGAVTKIRFTLVEPDRSVYIVPKGTRVSNGRMIFATDEPLQIPAGRLSGEVSATALTPGTQGNHIPVGDINIMVDPIPGIASISNLEESSGGGDAESDAMYAQRIRLAPDSLSVAGPTGAYVYHSLSYSPSVIDVSVYGLPDRPGYVFIHPLLTGGEIPEQSFLTGLKDYLSADTIRPLTDMLEVTAPEAIDYTISFKWYINLTDLDRQGQISQKVKQVTEEYRLWQQGKIGRNINPDELIKRLKEAGAERMEITSPVFTPVEKDEVAQCPPENIVIEFGGTEE